MSTTDIGDQLRKVSDRLDAVNQHLENLKKNDSEHKDGIKALFVALKGNDLNGEKGFIYAVDKLVQKVEQLERENLLINNELSAYKWTIKGIATSLMAFFLWFFTNQKH